LATYFAVLEAEVKQKTIEMTTEKYPDSRNDDSGSDLRTRLDLTIERALEDRRIVVRSEK
jgi:hypothetical protein